MQNMVNDVLPTTNTLKYMLYDRYYIRVSDGAMLHSFDREVWNLSAPQHGEICKYRNINWDGHVYYVTSDGEQHNRLEDALAYARRYLPCADGPVTGGRKGFMAALKTAYESPGCADPVVRYTHHRGFYVVSLAEHPKQSHELFGRKAEYVVDETSGKRRRSLQGRHYKAARRAIQR